MNEKKEKKNSKTHKHTQRWNKTKQTCHKRCEYFHWNVLFQVTWTISPRSRFGSRRTLLTRHSGDITDGRSRWASSVMTLPSTKLRKRKMLEKSASNNISSEPRTCRNWYIFKLYRVLAVWHILNIPICITAHICSYGQGPTTLLPTKKNKIKNRIFA